MSLESPAEWDYSDAWFLAGLAADGRPRVLWEIVMVADYLERSLLEETEAERAVGRLQAANLVAVDERGYRLTRSGRNLVATSRLGTFSRIESVWRQLQLLPLLSTGWRFPPGEFASACERYLSYAARARARAESRRAVRA